MWFRLGRILSVIACISLAGGHLALLQTAAWTEMLVDYGNSFGMKTAVTMTFDGNHPCPLCRKIETEKKRESAPGAPLEIRCKTGKHGPAAPAEIRASLREPAFRIAALFFEKPTGNAHRDAPPSPPPRALEA